MFTYFRFRGKDNKSKLWGWEEGKMKIKSYKHKQTQTSR